MFLGEYIWMFGQGNIAEIPSRKDIAAKVVRKLASPAGLLKFLEFKFVSGNEYPYFDFADMLPSLAAGLDHLPFRRLNIGSPVLLAGLRRSGTTLLYRIMSAQKSLFLFNERFPGDRLGGRGTSTARNLLYRAEADDFRAIANRYLSPLLRARYDRWGVKLALELAHPHPGSISAQAMERILAAYPDARVVMIVRDPRDFVMSAMKRGGHDVDWWIDEYLAMLDLVKELHARHGDSIMTIRYEDVVGQPGEVTRRCCEFAGLAFRDSMLDPGSWPVKGPREYESRTIVTNSAKWKNACGLDRAVVEKVAEACFPAASRLGYEYHRPSGLSAG